MCGVRFPGGPLMIYPRLSFDKVLENYQGQRVHVHIADSNGRWAVSDEDRQMLFNTDELELLDATTYVDQALRKQCVKHVRLTHAYVVGTIGIIDHECDYERIDYDPHKRDHFYWYNNGQAFKEAKYAYCGERHVFASMDES